MDTKMKVVNIHEAKTQLSKYLQDVAEGKEVVIGRYGQPIARLVPYRSEPPVYKLGVLKGKIDVADDFDAVDESLVADFEGRS
jgi:prevent-host-death family protein